MKNHFYGLDVLRGFGVFMVLILHSAFYYFGGVYDIDFNNPPILITVLGLLLMFAGMFGMISGFVHTLSAMRKTEEGISRQILKYGLVYGAVMLAVAYSYFIFTGPGIIDFNTRSMDNSILVEFLQSGKLILTSFERLFYIDSLVMIGTNIILLAIFSYFVLKIVPRKRWHLAYFVSGITFMALSLVRIPLFTIFQNALDTKNFTLYLFLNPLVGKNNPIFPYFAFSLLGGWIAALTRVMNFKGIMKRVVPVAASLFLGGVLLYVNLEDTMLERSIDLKWYSIMLAQLGLFLFFMIAVLRLYDYNKGTRKGIVSNYFARFSKAGLTAFFLESVVSAAVYKALSSFYPGFYLGMSGALLYGLSLALLWGAALVLWEKADYIYSLEYFMAMIMNKVGKTQKLEKLQGRVGVNDVRLT